MLHWIKFNLVGVVGFVLQSSALFILTHTAPRFSYHAATAVAVELAVLNNFVWHQRWTWCDRPTTTEKGTLRGVAEFHITTVMGLVGRSLVLIGLSGGPFGLPVLSA